MIPFTQYLRPDGRQKQIELAASDGIEEAARSLIARGFRFEAEVLVTGEVSLTMSDGEEDVAIEIVQNGFIKEGLHKLVGAAMWATREKGASDAVGD